MIMRLKRSDKQQKEGYFMLNEYTFLTRNVNDNTGCVFQVKAGSLDNALASLQIQYDDKFGKDAYEVYCDIMTVLTDKYISK